MANTSSVQPMTDASKIESVIAKKTNGAYVYTLLSMFGFTAIVACPLAFLYATQALNLIRRNQVGEHYRGRAKVTRIMAAVVFVFYSCIAITILSLALTAPQ